MALVALAPARNPLTIVLALFVIGARQLGFAILMHEAAHRSLFGNRRLNDWAGNWLAAYPVWAEVEPYRRYHLVHHAHTGTARRIPTSGLITPFPITRASFRAQGVPRSLGTDRPEAGEGRVPARHRLGRAAARSATRA